MAISVSKINSFDSCKLKYKLQYIDKVKQDEPHCFKKGKEVHKKLENISESSESFKTLKVLEKYKDVILNGKREEKIGLKVLNGTVVPCDFKDSDAFFHGIIDVLGVGYLLDYKTGKSKSFKEQDWTQLMYYSAWYFLKNPDARTVTIAYLYVDHDTENAIIISRDHLNEILKKILKKAIEITKYEGNPTDEHTCNWQCEYCTVNKHCKHFQSLKGLEKIEFETIEEFV